jgi:tRNA A-37 threonylcarbamoyl transferase component Bud32
MKLPLWHSRRISKALTPQAFERLCEGAEILEQDAHGRKVLRLPDGHIFKLFRLKHLISSARIYSYARQFCRNAERLQVLGIPTVRIRELYHFADSANSAVLYDPLVGKTVRQLARERSLDDASLSRLGQFISDLHDQGVYFRSLHMGNIVQCPDGGFGLIDVADMSIYPWSLRCGRRLRNLYHVCRLHEDIRLFDARQWQALWQGYFGHANLGTRCQTRMAGQLARLSASLVGSTPQ